MESNPDEYLMLSGIQHFEFCPRQWALIHIEQQWDENVRTLQGKHLHRNADQPFIKENRGNKNIVRAMPVQSHSLKISGVCDVVEFVKDSKGVFIPEMEDKYKVYPVEYKRGKPKQNDADILQLTAQAICLEEMLLIDINKGFLFYDEIKRRVEIEFTTNLKQKVRDQTQKMQEYYIRKHTPKVKTGTFCKNCSLKDVCLPDLMAKESASKYIERKLKE